MSKIDVYGEALTDYFVDGNKASPLLLYTNEDYEDSEIMPIDIFFRGEDDFPEQELIALALCDGKVLDIGAGVGSHTLYLQENGMEVIALEQSTAACQIMSKRGVKNIINEDIFLYEKDQYDTLLLLMNGIGLVENVQGLKDFFEHSKKILKPGGQLLFDTSDISYYYLVGNKVPTDRYFGEVLFQYEYKNQRGNPFGWLYIDQKKLIEIGQEAGFVVQILDEDDHYQYLVRMELRSSF